MMGVCDRNWFAVCELAVHAVFHVHAAPDKVLHNCIVEMYQEVLRGNQQPGQGFSAESTSAQVHQLARFLFVLGQTALNTLVFTEKMSVWVKQSQERARAAAPAKKSGRKAVSKEETAGAEDDAMEAEIGMAAARDAEQEQTFLQTTEYDLVVNESNLLGQFSGLIAYVAANEAGGFSHPLLQHTAMLSLCRYMAVSSICCEKYLPLLFTLVEKQAGGDASSALRTTVSICLGDLAFRFPNSLEPWNKYMYQR